MQYRCVNKYLYPELFFNKELVAICSWRFSIVLDTPWRPYLKSIHEVANVMDDKSAKVMVEASML